MNFMLHEILKSIIFNIGKPEDYNSWSTAKKRFSHHWFDHYASKLSKHHRKKARNNPNIPAGDGNVAHVAVYAFQSPRKRTKMRYIETKGLKTANAISANWSE